MAVAVYNGEHFVIDYYHETRTQTRIQANARTHSGKNQARQASPELDRREDFRKRRKNKSVASIPGNRAVCSLRFTSV